MLALCKNTQYIMDVRNEVLYRVYGLLFGIFIPFALLLVYKTFQISVLEKDKWVAQGESNYMKEMTIEPERGNIYSSDGSLLATSVPLFDVYFDPYASREEDYLKYMDTLAVALSTFLDEGTPGYIKDNLIAWRDTSLNKRRHILLKRGISFTEKKRVESFPLFNLGRYRGGLKVEKRSVRKRPFALLARRTIGYVRDQDNDIGLEGYFKDELGGKAGQQVMIKVDPKLDLWMPVNDLNAISSVPGHDIVSTIDINVQDIAERALYKAMNYHQAEWGTAVVMEVETGKIKAIANLGEVDDKGVRKYYEIYNYAVGRKVEPGSTFKLATMMALLEDGHITLTDKVDIENGMKEFYDVKMVDASSHSFKLDTITVRKAFEISSNVGMAKLVDQYYGTKGPENDGKGAAQFVERLKKFHLDKPTGIQLNGEPAPFIKEAYSEEDLWSGITLPWMSTGYELKMTPLQLLNFYNAVANQGHIVKPMIVTEVQSFGKTIETYTPVVNRDQIASDKTLEQAHQLLEGVVERGTAKKLKTDRYRFAGKTGTAQINYKRGKKGTRVGGYQASFVGYFPAEDPVYSCIVVINKPRQNGIYGSAVAGPVFRKIADECYASLLDLRPALNKAPKPIMDESMLPSGNIVYKEDFNQLADVLGIESFGHPTTEMVYTRAQSDSLILERRTISENIVPNVGGMGVRDAVYLLENMGIKVKINGVGKVVRQSILPGTKIRNQTIELTLN